MPGTDVDVIDHIDAFVVQLDPEGRLQRCVGATSTRLPDLAFVGRPFWETPAAPDALATVRDALRRCRSTRRPVRFESRWRAADGPDRWIAWSATPVSGADGAVRALVLTGVDRTEAHQAELETRARMQRYEGMIQLAADAIVATDAQQRITVFNRGAETTFGWRADQVLGQPLDMLLPERFRAVHRRHVTEFGAGEADARTVGDRTHPRVRGLRRDGEEFPAEATIVRFDSPKGRVYTAILRDVSHDHRLDAEQRALHDTAAVLASSLDYERTLTHVADLAVHHFADVCMVDVAEEDASIRRLRVVHRDPARQALADRLQAAPLDRSRPHLLTLVEAEHRPVLVHEVSSPWLLELAQTPEREAVLRELRPRSLIGVPLLARGRMLGAMLLLRTETSRAFDQHDLEFAESLAHQSALAVDNARLYRAAQRAVDARDRLVAVLAHDLRNPLSSVRLAAATIDRLLPDDAVGAAARRSTTLIRTASDRALRMIADLLDVSRMESGTLTVHPSPEAPEELARLAMEALLLQAEAARLKLVLEPPAQPLPPVLAERDRVVQALGNLLGNAVKFSPPGGEIRVTLRADERCVTFEITDQGPGMPPDYRARIFRPYWQGRRGDAGGLGLGLYIVHGIARAHGGDVELHSEADQGTRARLRLRRADA